jgi:hypothetical protein
VAFLSRENMHPFPTIPSYSSVWIGCSLFESRLSVFEHIWAIVDAENNQVIDCGIFGYWQTCCVQLVIGEVCILRTYLVWKTPLLSKKTENVEQREMWVCIWMLQPQSGIDVPYEVIVFYFETKVRVFYSIFEDAFKST